MTETGCRDKYLSTKYGRMDMWITSVDPLFALWGNWLNAKDMVKSNLNMWHV